MQILEQNGFDLEWRRRLDDVYEARVRATGRADNGDVPSVIEIRDILRLFARVRDGELRQAVINLLRAIGPLS